VSGIGILSAVETTCKGPELAKELPSSEVRTPPLAATSSVVNAVPK
jgi:hypothetical protein